MIRSSERDTLAWLAAFGRPVNEVFYNLSAEPVASASLGQVYRGQLRGEYGGGEVAVKVQRPAVQESVALDLLLMRRFAAYAQTFPQVCCAPACWCPCMPAAGTVLSAMFKDLLAALLERASSPRYCCYASCLLCPSQCGAIIYNGSYNISIA